jgi:hypothetical protein
MAKYALAVVPADWDLKAPLQLTEAEHTRVVSDIEQDTRVILYQLAPRDAVVAEGAVTPEEIIRVADWPAQNVGDVRPGTAYLLPVRIAYQRGDEPAVGLNDVRMALEDPAFPRTDQVWVPIDRAVYEHLRVGWPPRL